MVGQLNSGAWPDELCEAFSFSVPGFGLVLPLRVAQSRDLLDEFWWNFQDQFESDSACATLEGSTDSGATLEGSTGPGATLEGSTAL